MTDFRSVLLGLPRPAKRALLMANDIVAAGVGVIIAFYLRLGELPDEPIQFFFAFALSVAIMVPLFTMLGMYHALVRFAGAHSFETAARAVAIYALIYAAAFFLLVPPNVPRTISLIQPAILLILSELSRMLFRRWARSSTAFARVRSRPGTAVIYGAGAAGRQLASALLAGHGVNLIGFIDDDSGLAGSTMQGRRIYPRSAVADLVARRGLEEVLLAIPSTTRMARNEIIQELKRFGLRVRTLPTLDDLSTGRVTVSDLREVEIEDLLGREAVAPHPELLQKNISARTVLVTGAAGSIGSEMCRQIVELGVETLLLYDISEGGLFLLERQLQRLGQNTTGPRPKIVPIIGSVRDTGRLEATFREWRPQTVYHAAAYKHVPLIEGNPLEAIKTNIFGTRKVAETAVRHGASNFVLISTDKAVRPSNVMGATKRAAELVLQAMHHASDQTTFCIVRFGNVLGSSGSVVPVFREQIMAGGPVTLTDASVTRFFMTIPEAAQLVIQAGALAVGGEVFLLDMGEPVRVYELARAMIELSGLSVRDDDHPDGDIEIKIVGLRPGEKLFEELLIGERSSTTEHPRIFKAHEYGLAADQLERHLELLRKAAERSDARAAVAELRRLVPEFRPREETLTSAGPIDLSAARSIRAAS
jgi:FlaA1/EpsC-like NDP-sugar epimerase